MRSVVEDSFKRTDRANELYLWGVLQAHRVMTDFEKKTFTVHPKFHPHMVMYFLDTMVPRVDLEDVSAAYANGSDLPVTV